jgi:hypothetical protein
MKQFIQRLSPHNIARHRSKASVSPFRAAESLLRFASTDQFSAILRSISAVSGHMMKMNPAITSANPVVMPLTNRKPQS